MNVYFSDIFEIDAELIEKHGALNISLVKKSLEFDYPPPKVVAFRQIHGFATVISKAFLGKAFSTLPHAEHVVF